MSCLDLGNKLTWLSMGNKSPLSSKTIWSRLGNKRMAKDIELERLSYREDTFEECPPYKLKQGAMIKHA